MILEKACVGCEPLAALAGLLDWHYPVADLHWILPACGTSARSTACRSPRRPTADVKCSAVRPVSHCQGPCPSAELFGRCIGLLA